MAYLLSEKFVLTTNTHGRPLTATMKRYKRASAIGPGPKDPATILFFGHGAGFPKEIWEPTLEDLLKLDEQNGRPRIREAWALDCQNHGEASIVNGEVLAENHDIMNIYDYADAFASLYKSDLLGKLDPELHKVILVGHSAGAVGVTLATAFFNPPSMVPFSALILVDHPMFSQAMNGRETEIYKLVEATTPLRRDIWKSREAAEEWLRSRPPWGTWDERVFDVYAKYGLHPLPTPYYPDKTGITLTTHRMGENMAFTGTRFSRDALYRLNQICDFVPVHLIYGARNDMFDREVQDSIIDPKEGRNIASVTRIKGAGHLVVQEAPRKVAQAIFTIVKGTPAVKSKL